MKAFAKKTFLALKNPYHTVEHVYPNVIDEDEPTLEKSGMHIIPVINRRGDPRRV